MALTHDGEIHLVIGPMFSGKSEELVRRVRRYSVNRRVRVVNPKTDTRSADETVRTHNGTELRAISAETIVEIAEELEDVDVVAIDEGQFFCDIVEGCEFLANRGKIVIVAALSGTYQRRAFEQPGGRINDLMPLCEDVTSLSAICRCGKDANFSKRTSGEEGDVVIGGKDKYEAVCRKCYFLK